MTKTRIVLFAVVLLELNFTGCISKNNLIPTGVYELWENGKESAADDCKVIKVALGHTLIVDNDSILTAVKHESAFEKYAVTLVKNNVFDINISRSSVTPILARFLYEPFNNQLEFCSGEMVYRKVK